MDTTLNIHNPPSNPLPFKSKSSICIIFDHYSSKLELIMFCITTVPFHRFRMPSYSAYHPDNQAFLGHVALETAAFPRRSLLTER